MGSDLVHVHYNLSVFNLLMAATLHPSAMLELKYLSGCCRLSRCSSTWTASGR